MRSKRGIKLWAVIFWVVLWEIAARVIGQEILLVSPVRVGEKFLELSVMPEFWRSIGFSFLRIAGGFLLALGAGLVLAAAASCSRYVRDLAAPPMAVIKAAPVASFIILLLIWIPSRNLSVIISFMMVLPIVYTNILSGIEQTQVHLLEMAEVFRISTVRKWRYIYSIQLLPYLRAACSLSLGLCWKAGIAAEVIGIPNGSIGEQLYEAKVYLKTPDLFAWTLTIILLSAAFEKLFLLLLKVLTKGFDHGKGGHIR